MRGLACIGLYQPKDVNNIGSVLRAAACFSADMVAVEGKRYSKSSTDTMKAWKHMPLIEVENIASVVPKGCEIVCVEIVEFAKSLVTFTHPERAFYIFGGEDRTLPNDLLDIAKHVVRIPTSYCLNLAAAVNIVLYDRSVKRKP